MVLGLLGLAGKKKVLVLGAGGKTGSIVLRKMKEMSDDFEVVGACRTEGSAQQMKEETGAETVVCDLTQPESLQKAMEGVETLVVLSSATPQLNMLKLLGQFACCVCNGGFQMGGAFEYRDGGYPEQVDWEGGRAAIDAARAAGVQHVVYVGSMGGTKPDHMLNQMGDGNILLWKRKAELYLRRTCMDYTIIHPGGLLPHPSLCGDGAPVAGGQRELLVGVNDTLMDGPSALRCIPREDLAEVVVQCAKNPAACSHKVFDLASKDPEVFPEQQVWDGSVDTLLKDVSVADYDYSQPEHPLLGA
jgi:uncharacterized protein YbjT (DUF2867 family)